MDKRRMNDETFERFVVSLKERIIQEVVNKYGVKPVYSNDKKRETEYWHEIKSNIDKGEEWLLSKMLNRNGTLDRHKYSALVLVVFIKKPLFKPSKQIERASCYSAGLYFAFEAALLLLGDYIVKEDKNYTKDKENYIKHIMNYGISPPDGDYLEETLRMLQTLFRIFKEEKKPEVKPLFPSMLDDDFNCVDEVWGFALLLANNISLIEKHSIADYERRMLHKYFKQKSG